MNALINLRHAVFSKIERQASWLLPTLARLVFTGVLLLYFWKAGATKLGDGIFGLFSPSVGAYAQIFPRAMEATGFDPSQLSIFHWAVVVAGTATEFILPLLLIVGLFTRLAALGTIGFIIIQSVTDIVGHNVDAKTIGAWFDRFSDSLIVDQRSLWVLLLIILVVKGAGPLSVDRLLRR
jgi:putative oxidoreductase